MTSPTKEHQRATRLREYDQALARAAQAVQVMGLIVRAPRGTSAAHRHGARADFAATRCDERPALPAGIWVALRRDDTESAIQALLAVAPRQFLVSEHEEMGPGFRLHLVEEKRELPDIDLLRTQLAHLLGIPADVVAILEEWGVDDPRTAAEIDTLLDSRFGPVGSPRACASAVVPAGAGAKTHSSTRDVRRRHGRRAATSEAQAKVLATLVRAAGVTVVS